MDDQRWKYLTNNITRQKKDIFLDSDLYDDSLIDSQFAEENIRNDSLTFETIIENFKSAISNSNVKDIISPKVINVLQK